MSLETAKGNAKLSRCEHGFTDILEILAFAIHPGSSESTTTFCLHEGKILMTSQSNLEFEGIDAQFLQGKLRSLRGLLLKADVSQKERINVWWDKHCVLSTQVNQKFTKTGEARDLGTIQKSNEKIDTVRRVIFQPAMEEFFGIEVEKKASLVKDLLEAFSATVVVLNEGIFRRAPETTGFHGESRILRYLFIKWATPYILSNSTAARLKTDLKQSRGDPEGECRRRLINYMERKFVTRSRDWGMVFGSSQGTCTGCCRALDICFAKRGKTGNTAKQWRDPLDLSGFQSKTQLKEIIREHALNLVLADFDHHLPEEEVPEDFEMDK